MIDILYYSAAFLFGAVWGSFFHTLSVRILNEEFKKNIRDALAKPSSCPRCQKKIKPLYLIPLAGYLLQRGRCSECGMKISSEYPLSEILYGLMMAAVIYKFGISFYSLSTFLLISVSMAISYIDTKSMTVPNFLVVIFLIISVYPIAAGENYLDSLFGMVLMFLIFFFVMLIFPGSFGGGDIKFASAIGLVSGFEMSVVVLEIALITGAIFGIIYALASKKGFRIQIPFAPFLSAGFICSIFFGRELVLLYLNISF